MSPETYYIFKSKIGHFLKRSHLIISVKICYFVFLRWIHPNLSEFFNFFYFIIIIFVILPSFQNGLYFFSIICGSRVIMVLIPKFCGNPGVDEFDQNRPKWYQNCDSEYQKSLFCNFKD